MTRTKKFEVVTRQISRSYWLVFQQLSKFDFLGFKLIVYLFLPFSL